MQVTKNGLGAHVDRLHGMQIDRMVEHQLVDLLKELARVSCTDLNPRPADVTKGIFFFVAVFIWSPIFFPE